MQLLLFQLGCAGVPVANLAVQAFLDRATGAFDAGFGYIGDLSEMR